jgi:hypothetical protein
MRAVPTLSRPLTFAAGYKASRDESGERFVVSRMPSGGYGEITIMSIPADREKADRILLWFIEHDAEFQLMLALTPDDEPLDVSTLVLACVRSTMQS